jgi:Xaa-Pro aminopeptidase
VFSAKTYVQRRTALISQMESGLILLLGHEEAPMNYGDNVYPFRQESSFSYYIGLDEPGLAAVIDLEAGTSTLFGHDLSVEDIVWTGPQACLQEKAALVGITDTQPREKLGPVLSQAQAQAREIHFLPVFRASSVLALQDLLGLDTAQIRNQASRPLIQAAIAQRSVKEPGELAEIEAALDISHMMHCAAMRLARPGKYEYEIVGEIEGLILARGARPSFPTIFSVHGETLHNPFHRNLIAEGDIIVHDSGVETPLHYASDITRTIPASGRFSSQQKEIYDIVLDAENAAIDAVRPGVEFRDIHRLASVRLLTGLQELGLIKGDCQEAVEAGAHTLFFQCGVGHMLGLDAHDMDALGEEDVGYTDTIRRNPAFGWKSLRLGKALQAGYVITVEPGIYFIPELIDQWRDQHKLEAFIDYTQLERYRDFGGVRLEDDLLVTDAGYRFLGKPIPRTAAEVEQACLE